MVSLNSRLESNKRRGCSEEKAGSDTKGREGLELPEGVALLEELARVALVERPSQEEDHVVDHLPTVAVIHSSSYTQAYSMIYDAG